jgi:DNA mismatch repair protein MutS2
LLDRDDRQLDRVLTELSASRSALEAEQREIANVRLETESVRAEHREKLEKLQTRRDKLFRSMREDLEKSFQEAHERVAAVIRELQRGGTARDAAHAREKLQSIEAGAQSVQREAGLADANGDSLNPIDWSRASAGDGVQIQGGGKGILASLPDRRGRVTVRLGSARMSVPMQRVGALTAAGDAEPPRSTTPRVTVTRVGRSETADPEVFTDRCDLHGLRVDEAIDRLIYALDRAASAGHCSVAISHGRGTGALRKAVREHLRDGVYISRFSTAAPEDGGEGVTIAFLR